MSTTKTDSFITSIDYFGQHVQLTFNKKAEMKTVLGGIVSLLMYFACIAFIISIGITLVFKLNPSTTLSTQSQATAPLVDINEEDMIFAFYVLGSDFKILNDPSIASLTAFQQVNNRTDASNIINKKIPIELKNCSEYLDFYKSRGFEKDFTANGLNNAYCLSKNDTHILGGNFIDSYYSTIQIFLTKCKNGTSVTCKSEDDIVKRLKQGYFEFYYLDWNVDPNNYDNPFKRYMSNYFLLLDPMAWKLSQIFFKTTVVSSNVGLIFDTFENKTKIVYDYFREQIDTTAADKGIVQVSLVISQNITIFTRIYMKFQDFFANIGGLIQACIALGYILTYYFTKYTMYEDMMKFLFSFKVHDNIERSIIQINKEIKDNRNFFKSYNKVVQVNRRKSSAKNPVILAINNFIESENQGEQAVKDEVVIGSGVYSSPKKQEEINKELEKKVNEYTSSMSSNFRLSFRNKIYKLLNDLLGCKFKRKAIKFYDAAYCKLHGYMDFLKLIELMKEFRQLKKIVLNKTQYELFKYQNKQLIKDDENEEDEEEEKEVKYNELYSKFLKSREKVNKNKIYKRLLENFDSNLSFIFEKIGEHVQYDTASFTK
jgi:hypothetical protein